MRCGCFSAAESPFRDHWRRMMQSAAEGRSPDSSCRQCAMRSFTSSGHSSGTLRGHMNGIRVWGEDFGSWIGSWKLEAVSSPPSTIPCPLPSTRYPRISRWIHYALIGQLPPALLPVECRKNIRVWCHCARYSGQAAPQSPYCLMTLLAEILWGTGELVRQQ